MKKESAGEIYLKTIGYRRNSVIHTLSLCCESKMWKHVFTHVSVNIAHRRREIVSVTRMTDMVGMMTDSSVAIRHIQQTCQTPTQCIIVYSLRNNVIWNSPLVNNTPTSNTTINIIIPQCTATAGAPMKTRAPSADR